jgi:dihydroorotate dehydrogenase (fumarate)
MRLNLWIEKGSFMARSISLKTRYAGIALENPIIVGACGKTKESTSLVELAQAGAAAVVMKTLFHGPTRPDKVEKEWELRHSGITEYEAYTLYSYESGPHDLDFYTEEIQRAVKMTNIPVIASICCLELTDWQKCAAQCMEAGAVMIELNVSCPVPHGGCDAITDIELLAEIVSAVRNSVSVPIAVKLSPQTSSPISLAKTAAESGADAVVLLNKFAGLDIDLDTQGPVLHNGCAAITGPWFGNIVRRWIAEARKNINIDICATGGIVSGTDVVKYILCGANCVQMAAPLYLQGAATAIRRLLDEFTKWMLQKGYSDVESFRGKALKAICST